MINDKDALRSAAINDIIVKLQHASNFVADGDYMKAAELVREAIASLESIHPELRQVVP